MCKEGGDPYVVPYVVGSVAFGAGSEAGGMRGLGSWEGFGSKGPRNRED